VDSDSAIMQLRWQEVKKKKKRKKGKDGEKKKKSDLANKIFGKHQATGERGRNAQRRTRKRLISVENILRKKFRGKRPLVTTDGWKKIVI